MKHLYLVGVILVSSLLPFAASADVETRSQCDETAVTAARLTAHFALLDQGLESKYPGPSAKSLKVVVADAEYEVTLENGSAYRVKTDQKAAYCVVGEPVEKL